MGQGQTVGKNWEYMASEAIWSLPSHFAERGRANGEREPSFYTGPMPRTIGICVGYPQERQAAFQYMAGRPLVPTVLQNNLIAQMTSGIRIACDVEDLRMVSYPYSHNREVTLMDIREDGINGLILVSGFVDPQFDVLGHFGIPILLLNRFWNIPKGYAAVFNVEGHTVSLALSHLYELGHRRIAYIAGPGGTMLKARNQRHPPKFSSALEIMEEVRADFSDTAVRRMERSLAWLEERRILDPNLVAVTYTWGYEMQMHSILRTWCEMSDPPTAIFCGQEGAATTLLATAAAHGIRVPQDLSIVGVDTESSLMRQTLPPLTCVEVPAQQMGYEAVQTMMRLIRGEVNTAKEAAGDTATNLLQVAIPAARLRVQATTTAPRRAKLAMEAPSNQNVVSAPLLTTSGQNLSLPI